MIPSVDLCIEIHLLKIALDSISQSNSSRISLFPLREIITVIYFASNQYEKKNHPFPINQSWENKKPILQRGISFNYALDNRVFKFCGRKIYEYCKRNLKKRLIKKKKEALTKKSIKIDNKQTLSSQYNSFHFYVEFLSSSEMQRERKMIFSGAEKIYIFSTVCHKREMVETWNKPEISSGLKPIS